MEKVLMISWAWYPSGGDWTYISNVKTLYEKNGYEVIALSTKNGKNVKTNNPAYFIDAPDYKVLNKKKNLFNGIKAVRNSIVSFNALKMIDRALSEHDIKIAHLHNIHHYITPAVIWKLKKAGVKIIWSLHDYKIICPESQFISKGKICEKCISGNFFQCTLNKCKKNSLSASLLASVEAYFYHMAGVYKKVDAYLCPSEFIKTKFNKFGFDDAKLHVSNLCYDIPLIDNFIADYESTPGTDEYILYVGRIEEVKGLRTLINALMGTPVRLKIVGGGGAEKEFKEMCKNEELKNIEFLGFKDKQSVFELTLRSKFVVCPSEWYENFPFSIIESFLFSKPVIGSRIGGIPELVIDGETGLLFEAGNSADLREKVLALWNNENLIKNMGALARNHVYHIVHFDTHWSKLNLIINNITTNDN